MIVGIGCVGRMRLIFFYYHRYCTDFNTDENSTERCGTFPELGSIRVRLYPDVSSAEQVMGTDGHTSRLFLSWDRSR